MPIRDAVIVDTVRTPIGKRKGALAGWHPTDLLGFTLRALLERNDVDPGRIDDVVGGCVTQAGEQGCNVTRNAWIAAGLPLHVPATSVDRQCGSSQQAMHFVAQGVMAGAYDLAVACGVESMTRAPMSSNARRRYRAVQPRLPRAHGPHARRPVLGRAGARRQVRRYSRGDGRVRRREPPARRGEHRERVLRPRDRPGAAQGRRRQPHRRRARRGRGHPARHVGRRCSLRCRRRGCRRTSPRRTSPPATRRR